jgi:N-acetylglucosamine-6-phosphate deacetylase
MADPTRRQSRPNESVLFRGGQVILPNRQREQVSVRIIGSHIDEVVGSSLPPLPGERVIDLDGATLAPGFVDVQCNGALGIDLASEPERLWEFASLLPRWGVTAVLPTIITSPPSTVDRALRTLQTGTPHERSAKVLGLHLEGPFLEPRMAGAHPKAHLRSLQLSDVEAWTSDHVALVTLAPELPGASEVIAALHDRGIAIAAGHTAATSSQLASAQELGVSAVTHLFNAMSPLHHREPGVIGHVFTDDSMYASLIVDGIHVDPSVVRTAWRLLDKRLVLISDAVAALGMPPGVLRLGEVDLVVGLDSVRLRNGTLAGSMLSLDAAVRNLVRFAGATLSEAVFAASSAPSALVGRGDIGAIESGRRADLVILDDDGWVLATWIDGKEVWSQGSS